MWVSPNEKYLFINYGRQCKDVSKVPLGERKNLPDLSVLFDLQSGEIVKEFAYDYVSDFTMYGKDSSYIYNCNLERNIYWDCRISLQCH